MSRSGGGVSIANWNVASASFLLPLRRGGLLVYGFRDLADNVPFFSNRFIEGPVVVSRERLHALCVSRVEASFALAVLLPGGLYLFVGLP